MKHVFLRLMQMMVIVTILSAALFALLSAMPGNPVDMLIMSNPRVKPEDVVRLKKLRGLDRPWYVQYVRWIWGYNDAHRPPTVDMIPAVLLSNGEFKFDLSGSIHDADFRLSLTELQQILQKERPEFYATLSANQQMVDAADNDKIDLILEELRGTDSNYYEMLMARLGKKANANLQIKALFGATVKGQVIEQKFDEPGFHRVWFVVTNSVGLQTVGSISIEMKPVVAALHIQPIPSQMVDDPQTFSVDLSKYVSDSKVKYELLDKSPGKIDEKGVYSHVFDGNGQHAIQFAVHDEAGHTKKAAFAVEVGPIPDVTRFNRGFLYVFVGDKNALGFSNAYKRPVWELLAGSAEDEKTSYWFLSSGRIANTLSLMIPAIFISLLIALPLGILSAYRQYSWLDYIVNFFAFIGISLPVFWFAIMVMFLFAEYLQWFPAGGVQTPGIQEEGLPAVLGDRLEHAVLPTLVLSIAYIGRWLRYMRASMLEVLPADYIRTARAKGLGERAVIMKHALRNALIPIVTIMALSIPALFGGAVLTETVFSWPGIGRLEYDAIANSDYYVAIVVFLISSVLVMFGNLLADLLYVVVDPRIRHG